MAGPVRSAFDVIYSTDEIKQKPVESRLSILLVHEPVDIAILKEAYFEIERRTKNIIVEVFNERGIIVPKERYVEIRNEKLVT